MNQALVASLDDPGDPKALRRRRRRGFRQDAHPAGLRAYIQSEMAKWTKILTDAGVKPE